MLTCKLITAIDEIPFALPLTTISKDGLDTPYQNRLKSFFNYDMLYGPNGASSFQQPAKLDILQTRVKLLDEDQSIKVQLEDVFNKTENNQKVMHRIGEVKTTW